MVSRLGSSKHLDTLALIVGLGNPGGEYRDTRHNAGFMVVERLAERMGSGWTQESRFRSRMAKGARAGRPVWLMEPQTYMNLSGEAVGAVAGFYRVPVERVLVVVDDADLALGQIRMRGEGSSGGHHGLDSVEAHFGTRAYPRLRVGIGRRDAGVREITGHVLGRFQPEEKDLLAAVLDRAAAQVECWLDHGLQKAMSLYNGAVSRPDDRKSA